jgi:hypothetical protein
MVEKLTDFPYNEPRGSERGKGLQMLDVAEQF